MKYKAFLFFIFFCPTCVNALSSFGLKGKKLVAASSIAISSH